MKKYLPILKRTKLFAGVVDHEIEAMLSCLGAQMKEYGKAISYCINKTTGNY